MKWNFGISSETENVPSTEDLFKKAALIGQGPVDSRAEIERQVKSDLEKPYEQLLADTHQELLHWDWPGLERIIHSQKRIASLEVRIAQNADKQLSEISRLTARVDFLTTWLLRLTWALIAIGAATLVVKIFKKP